jgi:G3E family GTPase
VTSLVVVNKTDGLPAGEAESTLARIEARIHEHDHEHADAVTVTASGPVSPGRLVDLLEDPPPGAYRIKGRVVVDTGRSLRGYVVNVVGRSLHVTSRRADDDAAGFSRLQRYRRLSD